ERAVLAVPASRLQAGASMRAPALLFAAVAAFAAACSSTDAPEPGSGIAPQAPEPVGSSDNGAGGASPGDDPEAPGRIAPPAGEGDEHPPLFVGRFDTTDPKGPRATWPGARIL